MNPPPWILNKDQVTLHCHVQPGAKQTRIVGLHDQCIKIQLKSPPVDGKANKMLIRFLADVFDCPKSAVSIKRGLSSRRKTVLLESVDSVPDIIKHLK